MLLVLVLDPPTLQCKLQWAISQKMISGYNFWLECPTKVRSTQLSYIFKALFRDTPLAHSFCNSGSRWQVARWPGGQATGGRWHEKIIGKWGIPEKSFKNVAQLRWPYLRGTLQSKVIAGNHFLRRRGGVSRGGDNVLCFPFVGAPLWQFQIPKMVPTHRPGCFLLRSNLDPRSTTNLETPGGLLAEYTSFIAFWGRFWP